MRVNKYIVFGFLALTLLVFALLNLPKDKSITNAASSDITLTSQADWEAGTGVQLDTTTTPGSMKIAVNTVFGFDPLTGDSNLAGNGALGSFGTDGTYLYSSNGVYTTDDPTDAEETFKYDPIGDSWSQVANRALDRGNHCSTGAAGKLYVLGGRRMFQNFLTTVEVYDEGLGTWQSKAAMSTGHRNAVCETLGNNIYMFGGTATPGISEVYDIGGNSWSNIATMPGDLNNGSGAYLGGSFYLFRNTVAYKYDVTGNSWTTLGAVPFNAVTASELNGTIYVVSSIHEAYTYDPGTDTYTSLNLVDDGQAPPAYEPRYSATAGDFIYEYLAWNMSTSIPFYRFPVSSAYYSTATHTTTTTQLDAGAHTSVDWTTFVPSGTIPANTSINFRFRTSTNATVWSAWSASTPYAASISLAGLTQSRYLQVETTLASTNGVSTPVLDAYTANYDYDDTPAPTCSDSIQNGDETGVDCGGSCPACPVVPTCSDGIQNGDETGVDCGGSCPACPETPPPVTPPPVVNDVCTEVGSITISPSSITLYANAGKTFAASVYSSDGTKVSDATVSWSTTGGTLIDNGDDSARYVAPAQPGTYFVTAESCGKTAVATVIVLPPAPPVIAEVCNLNGIQDGDETGIDCGGSLCPACPLPPVIPEPVCVGGNCNNQPPVCIGPLCLPPQFCISGTCYNSDIITTTASVVFLGLAALLAALALIFSIATNYLPYIQPSELLGLFLKGRNKKHGTTVYDVASGLPVPLVQILLVRARDRKLISIVTSDRSGRFSLPTPAGEEYYVEIRKEGFVQLLEGDMLFRRRGLAYEPNYFGGGFRPNANEDLFKLAIPLVSTDKSIKLAHGVRIFETITKILRVLNIPLILFGLTMTLIALNQTKNVFNYTLLCLYILVIGYLIIQAFLTARTYGVVINANNHRPVDLAIVRAITENSGKLAKTSVTGQNGHYAMALPKGYYKLLVTKTGLEQVENQTARIMFSLKLLTRKISMSELAKNQPTDGAPTSATPKQKMAAKPLQSAGLPKIESDNRISESSSEIIENFGGAIPEIGKAAKNSSTNPLINRSNRKFG